MVSSKGAGANVPMPEVDPDANPDAQHSYVADHKCLEVQSQEVSSITLHSLGVPHAQPVLGVLQLLLPVLGWVLLGP